MDNTIHNWPSQTFILTKQILETLQPGTVIDTINAMVEAKIANTPYPEFSLQIPSEAFSIICSKQMFIRFDEDKREILVWLFKGFDFLMKYSFIHDSLDPVEAFIRHKVYTHSVWVNLIEHINQGLIKKGMDNPKPDVIKIKNEIVAFSLACLIVLLATRNIRKDVQHNKRKWVASGKFRSEYVTTLKIGQITETKSGEHHTGVTICAHLRRGHIRHQPCGVGLTETKIIWIAPIFVNADQEYIQHRKEYRVTT